MSENERLIPVVVPEKWCMYDQLHKIQKEYDEALLELDALEDNSDDDVRFAAYEDKQSLAEELVDIQVACETALSMLGLNQEQRDQVRQRVNQKNALRGYHGN